MVPSMGSAGDAYDNALAEAFFATLETELLQRQAFLSRGAARVALSITSRDGTTRTDGTPL